MITVQFYAVVNGKNTNVGKLIWDGKKFTIKSKRRSVKTILEDPITVPPEYSAREE